jgi:uncharacterized protein YutE (UPF0331/DUF86 family)
MITSTHPAFARLGPKLGRAQHELDQLAEFLRLYEAVPRELVSEWGRTTAVASAVHNAYNGIEDVLLSLANDIDGYVPRGDSSHQDILDQMRVPLAELRPALLDEELYQVLAEVKGFRHLVRHRYGLDLDPVRTMENLARMQTALPRFAAAVQELADRMGRPDAADA